VNQKSMVKLFGQKSIGVPKGWEDNIKWDSTKRRWRMIFDFNWPVTNFCTAVVLLYKLGLLKVNFL
jgi:hypothetical protein